MASSTFASGRREPGSRSSSTSSGLKGKPLHTQDVIAKDHALREMIRHLQEYLGLVETERLKTMALIESLKKCMSNEASLGSRIVDALRDDGSASLKEIENEPHEDRMGA